MMTTNARDLSDQLVALLRTEHGALADFVVALADFDRRRLWAELGHANVFDYLVRELGVSRGSAHYRKIAARLVQQYPAVEAALRDGSLCFSSVVELSKVITTENAAEVLPRFLHRSKQEAKAVVAELHPEPAPALRAVVTVAPPSPARTVSAVQPVELQLPASPRVQPVELQPTTAAPPGEPFRVDAPRDAVEPMTDELRRLHLTVSKAFLAKLYDARDALSHVSPGADLATILEAGLDLILAARDERRGTSRTPASKKRPAHPDTITADVRRAVWTRDQGRCQFRLPDGDLCGSTFQCELDHVTPKALGGEPTVDELRVLCRAHNQLAARRAFGDGFIHRKIAERQATARARSRERRIRPGVQPDAAAPLLL